MRRTLAVAWLSQFRNGVEGAPTSANGPLPRWKGRALSWALGTGEWRLGWQGFSPQSLNPPLSLWVGWGVLGLVPFALVGGLVALAFEAVEAPRSPATAFALAVAGLGAALVGDFLLRAAVNRFGHRFRAELRRSLIHHMHQVPLSQLDGAARGEWVGGVLEDVRRVERFYCRDLPRGVRDAGAGLVSAIVIVVSGAWAPLVAALFLAVLQSWGSAASEQLALQRSRLWRGVDQLFREALFGLRTLRSQGAEAYLERRLDAQLAEMEEPRFRGSLGSLWGVSLSLLVAALFLTGRSSAEGANAVLPWVATALLPGLYLSLLGWLVRRRRLSSLAPAVARLRQLVETPPVGALVRQPSRRELKPVRSLQFRAVAFRSSIGASVGPFDWEIRRGQIWVVQGPPSGKSTLLEILAGLRCADEGQVVMKGEHGRELGESAFPDAALPRDLCGYCPSEPFLLPGSLRENLTLGNNERVSDTVIWGVLERVGLFGMAKHQGGLDAPLDLSAGGIQEGTRRRVALGRALLSLRPWMVMDDPFRGQDEAGLKGLVRGLQEQRRFSGMVIVAQTVPEGLEPDGVLRFKLSGDRWEAQVTPLRAYESVPSGDPSLLRASAQSAQPTMPNI